MSRNSRATIRCIRCGARYSLTSRAIRCSCGGLLQVEFDELPQVSWRLFKNRRYRLWRYRELIPLPPRRRNSLAGRRGDTTNKAQKLAKR